MDDGELYGTNRDDFDPVEDICVMPYSSGTTGKEVEQLYEIIASSTNAFQVLRRAWR